MLQNEGLNSLRAPALTGKGFDDTLRSWAEAYFRLEVTTALSSQKIQRHDLNRFITFIREEERQDQRPLWTPRLSKAFIDHLKSEYEEGKRRYADATIRPSDSNRTIFYAKLKTFK